MSEHDTTRCTVCRQEDDHPKVHVAGGVWHDESTLLKDPTMHYDCISDLYASNLDSEGGHEHVLAMREAAQGGTKGQELRDHIHASLAE